MKPTSVIYLVFSVILFIGGFGMCKYAEKLADDRNQPIYDIVTEEDGSTFYSFDVDNTSIASLKLYFSNVDVKLFLNCL